MSNAVLAVVLFATAGQYGFPESGGPVAGPTNGIEQLQPFDAYEPWVHGQYQDIPAYGGYFLFRPYNYKHVLSQSQVAAGWGMNPTLAYSQEYFRRREQAVMEQRLAPPPAAAPYEMPALRPAPSRLRAQRDYAPPSDDQQIRRTGAMGRPQVMELPAPRGVNPAYYVTEREARLEAMQERIQQQSLELQAMQEALDEEYRAPAAVQAPYAAPAPVGVPAPRRR